MARAHPEDLRAAESLKTDDALLLYTSTKSKKAFLNRLSSTLETCGRFLFPNWSHVCSGFQFSEDTGRVIRYAGRQKKDQRVIRHLRAWPQEGQQAPKSPQQEVKQSHTVCTPGPELCPPSLRSTWRLKGRSVTDDILASSREQLHLPVPRVSVHYTGQRSEGTTMNWVFRQDTFSSHKWHSTDWF